MAGKAFAGQHAAGIAEVLESCVNVGLGLTCFPGPARIPLFTKGTDLH